MLLSNITVSSVPTHNATVRLGRQLKKLLRTRGVDMEGAGYVFHVTNGSFVPKGDLYKITVTITTACMYTLNKLSVHILFILYSISTLRFMRGNVTLKS